MNGGVIQSGVTERLSDLSRITVDKLQNWDLNSGGLTEGQRERKTFNASLILEILPYFDC